MAIMDPNILAQQELLKQQEIQRQQAIQDALAAQGPVALPVAAGPGNIPVTPGVSPLTMPAVPTEAATILGMSPEQFAAVAGGIGQALAPVDTWQSRLGGFAKSLGQGKIIGGLTGTDVTGPALTPAAPATAKKSALKKPEKEKLDLSNTLLGE